MDNPTAAVDESERLRAALERERAARVEAEAIARERLADIEARQRQFDLLEEIAAAANRAESFEAVLAFAVARVGEWSGWPLGHAFVARSPEGAVELITSGTWHDTDPPRFAAFRQATERRMRATPHGLAGRAMASGTAAWIPDVTTDASFARRAQAIACGVRAAFAFPVRSGEEVVAVIEFFSHRSMAPDAGVLRLMEQIGTLLGRVAERSRAESRLRHVSSHDGLTGLPNRRLFLEWIRRSLARVGRYPDFRFAVLVVDLDGFRRVNDSLGHAAGDQLIVELGRRVLGSIRRIDVIARPGGELASDAVARLGGDEFTILLEDIRDASDAYRVAERVGHALREPFRVGDVELHLAASIGIAAGGPHYEHPEDLLRDADTARVRAKQAGSGIVLFNDGMHDAAVRRLRTEADLRRAALERQFLLHYQPIVALATGGIVGFEALVRWRTGDGRLIPPNDFIPIAEETGLIVPIGTWVLEEACRALARCNRERSGDQALSMSINVSARQFAEPDFARIVRSAAESAAVDPRWLRLEITESVTLEDPDRASKVIEELQGVGVMFSMDDFGTGHSSLSRLHRLRLDVLKIDRSFVMQMIGRQESLLIVNAIIGLARSLGMQVVAEGTETAEHVARLRAMECQFAQGYFFSRPIEEAMALRLAAARIAGGSEHA